MKRFSALIATALLLAVTLDIRPSRPEHRAAHGRYTAEQILDRTEPLCRVLLPAAGRLSMSADFMVAPMPGRRPFRTWGVDCDDAEGRTRAHFDWDAETGDLTWASRATGRGMGAGPPPSTREQAIEASWEAVQGLGIDRLGHGWRLREAPEEHNWRGDRYWGVWWQADDRAVYVMDRGYDSLLVRVVVNRTGTRSAAESGRHGTGLPGGVATNREDPR